jgi:hypothetical protein
VALSFRSRRFSPSTLYLLLLLLLYLSVYAVLCRWNWLNFLGGTYSLWFPLPALGNGKMLSHLASILSPVRAKRRLCSQSTSTSSSTSVVISGFLSDSEIGGRNTSPLDRVGERIVPAYIPSRLVDRLSKDTRPDLDPNSGSYFQNQNLQRIRYDIQLNIFLQFL